MRCLLCAATIRPGERVLPVLQVVVGDMAISARPGEYVHFDHLAAVA